MTYSLSFYDINKMDVRRPLCRRRRALGGFGGVVVLRSAAGSRQKEREQAGNAPNTKYKTPDNWSAINLVGLGGIREDERFGKESSNRY